MTIGYSEGIRIAVLAAGVTITSSPVLIVALASRTSGLKSFSDYRKLGTVKFARVAVTLFVLFLIGCGLLLAWSQMPFRDLDIIAACARDQSYCP
jgi:hypothetical protein